MIPIPEAKESVEGSPPSTEDDRRMRFAETLDDMQGGLMESKLTGAGESRDSCYAEAAGSMDIDVVEYKAETDTKELLGTMRREKRVEVLEADRDIMDIMKS